MALTGGTLGKVTWVDKDYGVLVQNYRVGNFYSIQEKSIKRFLMYVLMSGFFQKLVSEKVNQGAQPNIGKEHIDNMLVPLPPPKEQERIVAKLDAAFDKIDAAIKLTEENLLHTQNLLPSALNDVFSKAEEKGWKIKTIEQTFKIKSGEFMSAKMMTDNAKYDVYGGNGINGKHTNYNLEGENIIIGRVGAKCGNVRFVEGKVWITDNAFFVSELLTPILKEYLAILLGNMELGKTANQAAQPVISYKGIKDLKIPLPDPTIQQTIVNQLNQLSTKQQQLQQHYTQQLKQLQALKASLLDAAFKGEL
jgi:type I restriction enzyme S subunit